MARCTAMHTAMTAAVSRTAGSSSRANAMNTALFLDAMMMASIFVVLLDLSVIVLISLITLIILRSTARRLGDPRPTFV